MLAETDFLQFMEITMQRKQRAAAIQANIYPFLFGLDSSWHPVCLCGKCFSWAVCVCARFMYVQVRCVLKDASFPSIFEESVVASFSLEAVLRGVVPCQVEGFRAPCIPAA